MQGAPKRVNGDANGVHSLKKNEISTPIFEGLKPNNLCEPQIGETRSTLEERIYNYSKKQKRKSTVRTTDDVTIGNNAAAGSTVVEPTVHSSKNATAYNSAVFEMFSKELSTVSQPESAEIKESDIKALYLELVQQKRWTAAKRKQWLS